MPPPLAPNARLENLPGVRPSKQQRSLAKRQRLMDAGVKLLRTENFDQVTIGRIAAEAGCSVGTFYERFADKDSFLIALQEDLFGRQLDDARDALAPARWEAVADADVIAETVEFVILSFTGDAEGVLRAALIQSAAKPHLWEPAKRSGQELADIVTTLLAPRLTREDAEEIVRIALQFLYGALVNMILRDPGPLRLKSAASWQQMAAVFRSILTA